METESRVKLSGAGESRTTANASFALNGGLAMAVLRSSVARRYAFRARRRQA
jgi:hypothetical protein